MPLTNEIRIRDPFVLTLPGEELYCMFGTTDQNVWEGEGTGFDAYTSRDLIHWEGPIPAFRPPAGFWADRHYWAPEVYAYGGRYFMFASFKSLDACRGTQVLAADSPVGPYTPWSAGPVTPDSWECLDGTLFVDSEGQPWMIFCHEWLQVEDGRMCAVRLADDLSAAVGEPVLLFRASEAPWTRSPNGTRYVTDGPYMHRGQDGSLLMLWSSIGESGYAMGIARSASGAVEGPWVHDSEPFYGEDGGHGMLFHRLDGQLMLTIHTPNKSPQERAIFLPVDPAQLERGCSPVER